jgi:hypothetical protein
MARRSGGSATAEWREPASSDRLPIHRSESPTGYSSAGCSPAEPASASPVTDNNSPIPMQRANQITLLNFTAGMQAHSRSLCPRQWGCHLYFARWVSFLSCADIAPEWIQNHGGALVNAARCCK